MNKQPAPIKALEETTLVEVTVVLAISTYGNDHVCGMDYLKPVDSAEIIGWSERELVVIPKAS